MKKYIFLCLALIFCLHNSTLSLASGGVEYEVKCENIKCNYTDAARFGGAGISEQITGYCVKCGKFVYLNWIVERHRGKFPESGLNQDKPNASGHVCLNTGWIEPLYKCPKCSEPFCPIESGEALKFCPKCKQATLKLKMITLYD